MHSSTPSYLLFLQIFFVNVVLAVTGEVTTTGENPFTPKSYLIRYWNKQISNHLAKPSFLLDKASPLTATDYAVYSKLADDHNSLSTHLPDFCLKANLLCLSPNLEKHKDDVNFTSYLSRGFSHYGLNRVDGADSFKNYSDGANVASDVFRRYSRGSTDHRDDFTSYADEVNVPDDSFDGYGTAATAGAGEFTNYNRDVNQPNLRFNAYSVNSDGRTQIFTEYSKDANSGDQRFTSYGKNGNGAISEFRNYDREANVMGSNFKNYGQGGNGGKDAFTSYGEETNVPENNFRNYGGGGNGGEESFMVYRNDSNVGDDDFRSYGRKSNAAEVEFKNYGHSMNDGSSRFSGYGSQKTDFKIYGVNTTFKGYNKEGVTFASYTNETDNDVILPSQTKGKMVNKWVVEPGKFFREAMLKGGNVMPMPDIRDKMPKRSFLPRVIVSKLPFSTLKINELEKIFHVDANSRMMIDSLNECERPPNSGETKRCVSSIEDMIDFSTSILGQNVTVRTTKNTQGMSSDIMIGEVEGINGGKVTKSVSCHQSLFPWLLYYCHSVPKVRVYEAGILDPKSRIKINHGVAICHLDTSTWSPTHGAFIALGSEPGKIEVCHWIYENDMTWTLAN